MTPTFRARTSRRGADRDGTLRRRGSRAGRALTDPGYLDVLLDRVVDARVVMLGDTCWFDKSQAVRPLHLRATDVLEPQSDPSGV